MLRTALFLIALMSAVILPAGATQMMAPRGYYPFCMANAQHCVDDLDRTVVWGSVARLVRTVNRQVNRSMRWEYDPADVWKLCGPTGDCEDYALCKRAMLIREGVPAGALRLAYAYLPDGTGHVVLFVVTERGPLVLDNRTNIIRPPAWTGYMWMRQATGRPLIWKDMRQ